MDGFFQSFPDLRVEVDDLFSTDDRMCVECTTSGTHEGDLAGVPATGRRIELPTCLVFRFDTDGLVAEENIYSDAATMFRQLGLLSAEADDAP